MGQRRLPRSQVGRVPPLRSTMAPATRRPLTRIAGGSRRLRGAERWTSVLNSPQPRGRTNPMVERGGRKLALSTIPSDLLIRRDFEIRAALCLCATVAKQDLADSKPGPHSLRGPKSPLVGAIKFIRIGLTHESSAWSSAHWKLVKDPATPPSFRQSLVHPACRLMRGDLGVRMPVVAGPLLRLSPTNWGVGWGIVVRQTSVITGRRLPTGRISASVVTRSSGDSGRGPFEPDTGGWRRAHARRQDPPQQRTRTPTTRPTRPFGLQPRSSHPCLYKALL